MLEYKQIAFLGNFTLFFQMAVWPVQRLPKSIYLDLYDSLVRHTVCCDPDGDIFQNSEPSHRFSRL